MGLFDRFKKSKPETVPAAGAVPQRDAATAAGVDLPQLCYDVAYFILPHYAYEGLAKLADMCLNSPETAGPFFYVMACKVRKVEPNVEDARQFRWQHGQLSESREYFVLEYPAPPPVDMSAMPLERVIGADRPFVLAPHFSAIIRGAGPLETKYYILGQAPMGGGTTLRFYSREGINCNLGRGPEPKLSAFRDVVRSK